jgi:hypothetical protein
MLSQRVINKILESGFYFDNEFDFEKNKVVLTKKTKEWFRENLGIQNLDSTFIDFYSFAIGGNGKGDELFDLERIIEESQNSFWKDKYPNLTDRYLQLSSIEGEGSYFYDKKTDVVYDVDWNQMDDFVSGKLKPKWKSFYDFLEWYYNEDD